MICPKCKADIPGDCWFCDQCGAELMFCPQCKTPAKGKRCTQCGSVLVSADQPYVSGTHAQITLHSSMKWLITDKGSTNGTRIGNTQLEPHKHYLLKKGQTVEIGFVKFRVE